MIREKRLSPRRAQSLAFLFLLGRTRGSPKTTPHPPAAPADRRRTERETPHFRTLVSTLIFDARLHSARLTAGLRLSPTARLQRKSTVCGLSGLRPCSAGSPPIKSSTRLEDSLRLLHRSLFAPCQPENCVPGLERKIAMHTNFSLQTGIVRFLERNTRWPTRQWRVTPATTNK